MPAKKTKPPVMGIIDCETKGNVIRFYIGNINNDYCGDDWDDVPMDANAGTVYSEFIDHYVDIAFPFNTEVFEPNDEYLCRNDVKAKKVPCVVVLPASAKTKKTFYYSYSQLMASGEPVLKFYFGDIIDEEKLKTDPNTLHITQYVKTKYKLV